MSDSSIILLTVVVLEAVVALAWVTFGFIKWYVSLKYNAEIAKELSTDEAGSNAGQYVIDPLTGRMLRSQDGDGWPDGVGPYGPIGSVPFQQELPMSPRHRPAEDLIGPDDELYPADSRTPRTEGYDDA
jgi:hypothetical protein